MLLQNLSREEILVQLKPYFSDEELDQVSGKLTDLMAECETIEDLIDEIDDYFTEDDGDELL